MSKSEKGFHRLVLNVAKEQAMAKKTKKKPKKKAK
jgi:hypothetical protein